MFVHPIQPSVRHRMLSGPFVHLGRNFTKSTPNPSHLYSRASVPSHQRRKSPDLSSHPLPSLSCDQKSPALPSPPPPPPPPLSLFLSLCLSPVGFSLLSSFLVDYLSLSLVSYSLLSSFLVGYDPATLPLASYVHDFPDKLHNKASDQSFHWLQALSPASLFHTFSLSPPPQPPSTSSVALSASPCLAIRVAQASCPATCLPLSLSPSPFLSLSLSSPSPRLLPALSSPSRSWSLQTHSSFSSSSRCTSMS